MDRKHRLSSAARGTREIVITRAFDAPPDLVFEAHIRPDLVRRWLLGPPGWAMTVCEIDARPGGKLRYEWRKESGQRMGLSGEFREVTPPRRIVHTELFDEDWTGGEVLATTEFSAQGSGTLLTLTLLYPTEETRDAVLRSGMERGVAASYDRLEDQLA